MRNPEATKETILHKSGVLFNTKGYKATSISDITDATGFTKGAIYRHFENKDELERKTLGHLSQIMFDKLRKLIKAEHTAPAKLRAVFSFFESYTTDSPLAGGCPLLNAAIEADDAHPALRNEALKAFSTLRQSLIAVLDNGIAHNQIKPSVDKEYYATVVIASLEGGIMMSKLHGNNDDIRRVIKHLNQQLSEIVL
ncbi:MAG: TetR/AcrR family transcriptional regulator [Cytophagales bacterium]|nr:TetR/AcrR family transcriptional regulator [Cytophagales bacterium]